MRGGIIQCTRDMKFWKNLSSLIEETLPEWRDKFLSYKDLKKQLKLIYPKDEAQMPPDKRPRLDLDSDPKAEGPDSKTEVTKEVDDFVRLLEQEIEKFNGFFVEKEEEYVIRLKVLSLLVFSSKLFSVVLVELFGQYKKTTFGLFICKECGSN